MLVMHPDRSVDNGNNQEAYLMATERFGYELWYHRNAMIKMHSAKGISPCQHAVHGDYGAVIMAMVGRGWRRDTGILDDCLCWWILIPGAWCDLAGGTCTLMFMVRGTFNVIFQGEQQHYPQSADQFLNLFNTYDYKVFLPLRNRGGEKVKYNLYEYAGKKEDCRMQSSLAGIQEGV